MPIRFKIVLIACLCDVLTNVCVLFCPRWLQYAHIIPSKKHYWDWRIFSLFFFVNQKKTIFLVYKKKLEIQFTRNLVFIFSHFMNLLSLWKPCLFVVVIVCVLWRGFLSVRHGYLFPHFQANFDENRTKKSCQHFGKLFSQYFE